MPWGHAARQSSALVTRVGMQYGNIAEADDPLPGVFECGKVRLVNDASPRHNRRGLGMAMNGGVVKHGLQFVSPLFIGALK